MKLTKWMIGVAVLALLLTALPSNVSPNSDVLTDENSLSDFDVMTASQSGTYRFTWQNTGSTAAALNVMNFFSDVEHGISNFIWGIFIALIVIIVIIVVIVLVVLSGDKKKTQPVRQFGPMAPPMAPVGGNCPMCGTPVEPQGMFCAKCGAKFR